MGMSADELVDRHVRRMVIGNAIAEAIGFLHIDALSAAGPKGLNFDLCLTPMAGGPYRVLAVRIGNGERIAKRRTQFRNFIRSPADITIGNDSIDVRIG